MNENNKATIYGIVAVLSWSTVATMFKMALRYYSHYEMLLVASFTSLIIFAVAMTISKKWSALKQLTKNDWVKFALVGLLNPVAYYLVLFKAYALLPAQITQPINYSWPIVLLVLLAIFMRQPIPKAKYIGMVFSLLGVICISLGSGDSSASSLPISGLLLALLSAFLWATYWIVNNKMKNMDTIVALFLSFLFGSVYLSIGTLFTEVDLSSAKGLLSSIYVGAFEMGIPFIFFALAIRKTSNPALVNQLCYLSPFISLFLIHIFLGEHIYVTTYIGLFLIVFGIVFNEYFTKYFIRKKDNQTALK